MKSKTLLIIIFIQFLNIGAFAQEASQTGDPGLAKMMTDPMNYFIVLTIAILLGAILVMARVIKLLTWQISGAPVSIEKKPDVKTNQVKKDTVWTKLNKVLSDSVPIEKEADVLLDHNYDGIKELDNNLPPWWKYGFYLTIFFAFIYMVHYHVVGSGNVQLEEYNDQLTEAAMLKEERLKNSAANVDENTVTIMADVADIDAGKKIYKDKCLVCHGSAGEGIVGPNLTDEYWIHGGSISDIFKIVKYGFPSKGMLAWQGQLTPVQMQQVSSYVATLKGTNPPNPKDPQGDLYVEKQDSTTTSVAEADTTITAEES